MLTWKWKKKKKISYHLEKLTNIQSMETMIVGKNRKVFVFVLRNALRRQTDGSVAFVLPFVKVIIVLPACAAQKAAYPWPWPGTEMSESALVTDERPFTDCFLHCDSLRGQHVCFTTTLQLTNNDGHTLVEEVWVRRVWRDERWRPTLEGLRRKCDMSIIGVLPGGTFNREVWSVLSEITITSKSNSHFLLLGLTCAKVISTLSHHYKLSQNKGWRKMTPSMLRLVLCKPRSLLQSCCHLAPFLGWIYDIYKGSVSAIVEPQQEVALFSPVTILR